MDEYDWIREGVKRPGKSRKGLAEAMGVPYSAITSLLGAENPRKPGGVTAHNKRRNLKTTEIEKIVGYLGIEPPPFHKAKTVPIIAVLTGEKVITPSHDADSAGSSVGIPPGDQGITAALIVRGGKMFNIIPGDWIVYISEKKEKDFDEFLSKLCVICYSDQNILVGVLSGSRYDGLYDLTDFLGSEDKVAQKVAWVARVLHLIPPQEASTLTEPRKIEPAHEILKIRNRT